MVVVVLRKPSTSQRKPRWKFVSEIGEKKEKKHGPPFLKAFSNLKVFCSRFSSQSLAIMDRPKRDTASRMRYNEEDGSDNDVMPQESAKKQRRTSKEMESDEEEAELDDEEDLPSRKSGRSSSNSRNKDQEAKRTTSRTSARAGVVKTAVSTYCEASSDDEFAQNNFMLPGSDDSDNDKKKRKSKSKSSRGKKGAASKSVRGTGVDADADVEVVAMDDGNEANDGVKEKDSNDEGNNESDSDSESGSDGDDIEYKVQHILGRWSATPSEWVQICANMNTREVTRGSVLQQPDEEFFSTSTEPVEKYLIKWAHASYLHVSWETQKDLAELVIPPSLTPPSPPPPSPPPPAPLFPSPHPTSPLPPRPHTPLPLLSLSLSS